MTMIPSPPQNLSKQHCYGGYVGGCSGNFSQGCSLMSPLEGYGCSESEAPCLLGSDLVLVVGQMAEDESRTESVNEAAGSSSKDAQEEKDDQRWLQLSIGGLTASHNNNNNTPNKGDQVQDQSSRRGGMIELDLLPAGSASSSSEQKQQQQQQQQQLRSLAPSMFHLPEFRAPPRPSATPYSTSLFLQHPAGTISSSFPQQEINWANFRPVPRTLISAPFSSSTSASLIPPGPYFARPFQLHAGLGVAGPRIDFRVIDPPRRPHSGIWFTLQAAQNQAKEPLLPQISKSFLRIKDGGMTIRLVIKYLVNKLKLESESEVEIRCRGQLLVPFLTLQHVRDSIWRSPSDVVTLLPDSSTTDHIMVLHYGRSA